MTIRQRLALASLVLAALVPACHGEDVVGGYLNAQDDAAREICECEYNTVAPILAKHAPYGSPEACVADFPTNSAERGCVEGLFKDEPVDYSAVLDCRADAERKGANCLAALTCTDTMRGACYTDYDNDLAACPDLPDNVESRLYDCLYN